MLYYNSRASLCFNNSTKIPCTKPWFCPSNFFKISLFMKVLKIGIFGRFLTEYKIHYLAIFLPNSIATGLPYLPAKDELVSLNRLSSRGHWKWSYSKVLTGDDMAWGSISLFAGFLEKENSLETLIVIFENVSPKGFFWLNMKNFEISVLTANSRYLQTAARKISEVQVRVIITASASL